MAPEKANGSHDPRPADKWVVLVLALQAVLASLCVLIGDRDTVDLVLFGIFASLLLVGLLAVWPRWNSSRTTARNGVEGDDESSTATDPPPRDQHEDRPPIDGAS